MLPIRKPGSTGSGLPRERSVFWAARPGASARCGAGGFSAAAHAERRLQRSRRVMAAVPAPPLTLPLAGQRDQRASLAGRSRRSVEISGSIADEPDQARDPVPLEPHSTCDAMRAHTITILLASRHHLYET